MANKAEQKKNKAEQTASHPGYIINYGIQHEGARKGEWWNSVMEIPEQQYLTLKHQAAGTFFHPRNSIPVQSTPGGLDYGFQK